MPCLDGRENIHTEYVERLHDGVNAARLCAVFSVLEKQGLLEEVLRNANWQGSGVSSASTMQWWEEHKARDRRRILREEQEIQRRRDRAAAIAKLNPKDRKVLGL
jgi:hypothetical protein